MINIILLVVGFIILIKGADLFVDGASNIALNFKISKILIGLTIVAFGTSAPEFAVSVKSMINGSGDIVLGNVIGSNILNILLIVGICSLFHPLSVKNNTVKKELPITLLLTILFSLLLSKNIIDNNLNSGLTRVDGITILLFFMVFIYYLISMARNKINESQDEKPLSLIKSFLFLVIGIISIVLGSNLVVDNATILAKIIGISEKMIALTIIALGTSLPELVTSITATKKGEYDIAIGNVIGSNIFNIGIVLGIPITLFGGIFKTTFNYVDIFVMLLSVALLFLFSFNDRKISKKEGFIFLILFIVYYSYIIIGGI